MHKISSIEEIIPIRTLEKIQDNFSEATGIGCLMFNLKGEQITKFSRQSRLMKEILKHAEMERELKRVRAENFEKCLKNSQIQLVSLYDDTRSFLVPIATEHGVIGFFMGGLTRLGNPNIVNCVKEADVLGMDLDSYLEMYLELELVTKEKLEACANLLRIIIASISHLAKEGSEARAKINEVISINDVLEKEVKITSRELKESEQRYHRIFNTVIDGIFETDLEGRIRELNPGGAQLLGYTRQELLGTMMKDYYVNPEDRKEFVKLCMRDGRVEFFHPHIRLKNGQTKYFETNAILMRDDNGKPIGIQGIYRDITPRLHGSITPKNENIAANPAVKSNQNN
jgi:PAS domain S-box-containing protein